MSLHVQCSTDEAILLVAVNCPDGLLRFPNDGSPWPGLSLQVQPLLGINEQLIRRSQDELGSALTAKLNIWQEYSDVIREANEDRATLYVAMIRPEAHEIENKPWKEWRTLPDLIRTLPKDRTRLAYLKAWQVLTGALEESTKALDVDEVARYLRSINEPKTPSKN